MSKQLSLFTPSFTLTETGLEVKGKPDFEEWMDYGQSLKTLDGTSRQFAIGDWIVHGFDTYEHGKWETIQQIWGKDDKSLLQQYEYVSKHVKSLIRIKDLNWSQHRIIADMPEDKQRYWLEKAVKESLSVKKLEEAIQSEKIAEIEEASRPVLLEVKNGDWWILGHHLLYCGDTSKNEFIDKLPDASFAFADPPYGAEVAEWDGSFYWEHDYLIKKAPIVAVTPGIMSIFNFAKITKMTYRWAMSFWISNGMTRGALGFGNWIYAALFSDKESIHKNAQDFYKVSITGDYENHKGQKPTEMIVKLIELFTSKDDIVIDPFLGSGTTLIVCDKLHRVCIGGEKEPEYCSQIIAKWEKMTNEKAKNANSV